MVNDNCVARVFKVGKDEESEVVDDNKYLDLTDIFDLAIKIYILYCVRTN